MKKTVLIFTLLVSAAMLSGCSMILEEPSTLILPPASDQEEYTERTLINSFLASGEHLQVPEEMDDPAAFVDVDVDEDEAQEKLVFWSNENGHEVGALLIQKASDGTWNEVDRIRQYGNTIDYFKLIDVNNDGVQEACIGFNVGGNNVLSIYQLDGAGFNEIDQIDYTFLAIVDMDGDGRHTLLTALNDYEDTTPRSTLTMYEGEGTLESVYEKAFDGNCVEMVYGAVSDSQKGLYYVRSSNYRDLNVELLLPEDNGFDEQMTARAYYVNGTASSSPMIEDITGDGVLDVRSVVEPIEPSRRDEGDYLQLWRTWDGKSGLKSVYGVIENNTDGYTFVLPSYCLDTVRYQFITEKGSSQLRLYDGDNKEPAIIIYAQTESGAAAVEDKKDVISLGTSPSSQRSYYALCNTEKFAGQKIEPDTLKQLIQIEGGQ